MDVKITNYIDREKQLAQKQAIADAQKAQEIEEFKSLLNEAVDEIKDRIDAKQQSNTDTTKNTAGSTTVDTNKATDTSSTLTKATSASEELGCPSEYDPYFEEAAKTYNVDINLLKAIAKAESAYQSDVVSSAGAIGIMQLMPGTAESLGVTDPYDPYQNIMGGAQYISEQLAEFNGDRSLALAAYNAGPGNVKKYDGIPPFDETQNYVIKITGFIERAENAEANGKELAAKEQTSQASLSNPQKVTKAQLYTSIEQALDLIRLSIEQLDEDDEKMDAL